MTVDETHMVLINDCMYQEAFKNTEEALTQCLTDCLDIALAVGNRPKPPGGKPKASDFGITDS